MSATLNYAGKTIHITAEDVDRLTAEIDGRAACGWITVHVTDGSEWRLFVGPGIPVAIHLAEEEKQVMPQRLG